MVYRIFSDGSGNTVDSAEKKSQTWESYEDYLQSEVWEEKREVVMDRADGVCEKEGLIIRLGRFTTLPMSMDLGIHQIIFSRHSVARVMTQSIQRKRKDT